MGSENDPENGGGSGEVGSETVAVAETSDRDRATGDEAVDLEIFPEEEGVGSDHAYEGVAKTYQNRREC